MDAAKFGRLVNVRRLLVTGFVLAGLLQAARAGAAGVPRVSIALVSGSPQTAHAYIAQHGNTFETQFLAPLVVRVSRDTTVRFRCTTTACEFPAQVFENDEDIHRVDVRTFDVTSENGRAQIKLLVSTPTVEPVTVVAQPAGNTTGARVTFHLIAQ
jgi:hypothetical protein